MPTKPKICIFFPFGLPTNIGMKSAYLYLKWFPLFLALLLIFMNVQIMQIWYVAYLSMEWKAYVLALF